MLTKAELYREAQHMVASRRQKAVTLAQQALHTANATVPGLEEARQAVSVLGYKAIQLAAKGVGAIALEDIQQQRGAAQQQLDDLLAAHGYAAANLTPQFTCTLCDDSGMLKGKICSCVTALTRQLRREEINKESPLALCSFSSMDLSYYPNVTDPHTGLNPRQEMKEILGYLHQYAEVFDLQSESLLITGNAGLGKTHAALAIAQTVLDKGFNVVYVCAQSLFSQLERERFLESSPLLEAAMEADLLILDDLGTEFVSAYVLSTFYNLLNTRLLEKRPTIYTTNIVDGKAFETRYTEKIASRLSGSCEPVIFIGDDIRQLKNM